MKINRMNLIYFSPTGTTRKVVMAAAKKIELKSISYDLTTNYRTKPPILRFEPDDFVLIGIPVYSGRVPAAVLEYLNHLKGLNTPAVLVATYGNRAYDDALLELKNVVEEKGLKVIAAAAFPVQHSIIPAVAKGRPDKNDLKIIHDFSIQVNRLLRNITDLSKISLHISGNPEYRPYKTIPLTPHTSSDCSGCKTCAKLCPASAINPDNPRKTNRKKCISCFRCVYQCPQKARFVSKFKYNIAKRKLLAACSTRKEPEIFI